MRCPRTDIALSTAFALVANEVLRARQAVVLRAKALAVGQFILKTAVHFNAEAQSSRGMQRKSGLL